MSGDQASHPFAHREEMWHPHLKRTWLDNDKFIVEDKIKNIPANLELLQLKSRNTAFLVKNDNKQNPKLNCGCKFIKDIVKEEDKKQIKKPPNETGLSEKVVAQKVKEAIDKNDTESASNISKDRLNTSPIVPSNFLQINENKQIIKDYPEKLLNRVIKNKSRIDNSSNNGFTYNNFKFNNKNGFDNQGQLSNKNINYQNILEYLQKNEMLIQNLKSMILNNNNRKTELINGYSLRNDDEIVLNQNMQLPIKDIQPNLNSNQLTSFNFDQRENRYENTQLPKNFFEQFIQKSSPEDNSPKENNYKIQIPN